MCTKHKKFKPPSLSRGALARSLSRDSTPWKRQGHLRKQSLRLSTTSTHKEHSWRRKYRQWRSDQQRRRSIISDSVVYRLQWITERKMHIPSRQPKLSLMTSNSYLIVGKQRFCIWFIMPFSHLSLEKKTILPQKLVSLDLSLRGGRSRNMTSEQIQSKWVSPSWIIVYTEVRSKHKSSENVQITKLPHTNYCYLINN